MLHANCSFAPFRRQSVDSRSERAAQEHDEASPILRTCQIATDGRNFAAMNRIDQCFDGLRRSRQKGLIAYIGAGKCSATTATACTVDTDCPAGEYCKESIGDHNSGLIRNIDDIQATSWTPFAEAFYNAMGYLARANNYTDSPPTSRSSTPVT